MSEIFQYGLFLSVIGAFIYWFWLGKKSQESEDQRKYLETLVKEKEKEEQVKAALDIELARKRQSVAELLRNIHSSD